MGILHYLQPGAISKIRRNHALEHATLHVLAEKGKIKGPLAGYSDPRGFWIVGQVDSTELLESAQEALERMQKGETWLAVHPTCGTNLAAAGVAAGTLSWLGMMVSGIFRRRRTFWQQVERWSWIVTLATAGVFIGQPLGLYVQEHITTAVPTKTQIHSVVQYPGRRMMAHRVFTK